VRPLALALILSLALTACASGPHRFVAFPTAGQDFSQTVFDQEYCDRFARANKNDDNALIGAGMGALAGGAYGAAYGTLAAAAVGSSLKQGSLIGLGAGLAVGVTAGVIAGAVADHQRYLRVYAMCMALRGYAVTD
jgi:hypothetical protein